MTCKRCNHTARKFGTYGKRHIQRYRCSTCKATFSEYEPKLGTHYTDPEVAAKALAMMLEGMSFRAISRLTGLHKGTILSLMNTAAERATALLDSTVRNVHVRYVQADEIWCFVGKKQRQVRIGDSPDLGDQWVFVAIDADTELLASYAIRKRTAETTYRFLEGLQSRIADARFQMPDSSLRLTALCSTVVASRTCLPVKQTSLSSLSCTATSGSMTTPKRGTPHQESRRLYPGFATDGPIPGTSPPAMLSGRIRLCGCTCAGLPD
jgi:transposase-like protein